MSSILQFLGLNNKDLSRIKFINKSKFNNNIALQNNNNVGVCVAVEEDTFLQIGPAYPELPYTIQWHPHQTSSLSLANICHVSPTQPYPLLRSKVLLAYTRIDLVRVR